MMAVAIVMVMIMAEKNNSAAPVGECLNTCSVPSTMTVSLRNALPQSPLPVCEELSHPPPEETKTGLRQLVSSPCPRHQTPGRTLLSSLAPWL